MTTPEIKVTFSALAAAQSDVQATFGRIQTQLDDLKRFLAPMVATWTGHAAENYQVQQRQWDTSAADLSQVLAQIGNKLGETNENYRATEASNARRFSV